ncbi:hypothetical protein [Massilia sp. S19_KUP03_FR1]|uniref:hypothetical protein n=1 Tax=Massilia sp. S19_KUP03_FR1 TaxID=3025503 RepID=UPI002FCD81D7
MRKSTFSLLFGILLAGSAVAAPAAQPALGDYVGRYVLADGRILTVEEDGGQLSAVITFRTPTLNPRFNGARAMLLKPDGLGSFVATSQALRITFGQDRQGDIAQVSLEDRAAPMIGLARR